MILIFIYYFIPFLFLFYMAIEIFIRDPKNKLHRTTMILLLSFSLLFLGDFFINLLPFDQAIQGVRIKLVGAYLIMLFGLYFFRSISKTSLNPILYHIISLIPLLGLIPVFTKHSFSSFEPKFIQGSYYRIVEFNKSYVLILFSIAAYAMIGFLFQIILAYRQSILRGLSSQEEKRIALIKKGSLISCGWVVISLIVEPILISFHVTLMASFTSYAVLIFAFFIRVAMVNYDFLSTTTRRYEILFAQSSNGIFLQNEKGNLMQINVTGLKMLGIQQEDTRWRGKLLSDFITLEDPESIQFLSRSIELKMPVNAEAIFSNILGKTFNVEIKTDFIEIEGHFWTYITVNDITIQKENEKKLIQLAYYDMLTGLFNRRRFIDVMNEAIMRYKEGDPLFAILLIDLDRFKWVNDTLGHDAGDKLLRTFASRLQTSAGESVCVARMGGDEFIILLQAANVEEEARRIAQRIAKEMEEPIMLKEHKFNITASIGIRVATERIVDMETLMRDADTAMYVAKQEGRNQYHLYQTN
jgi:diguanylate cyclase (GGDEF)-like protein/PAS domain S-box-containing protein